MHPCCVSFIGSIPLHNYILICLSTHALIAIWIVSNFWLLWANSLWLAGISMYIFLGWLVGKYLAVKLLCHIIHIRKYQTISWNGVPFSIHIRDKKGSGLSHLYLTSSGVFVVVLKVRGHTGVSLWFCSLFPCD